MWIVPILDLIKLKYYDLTLPFLPACVSSYIGKHAIPNLVKNLPGGQQNSSWNFSEDTVVSILNTINEVIAENLEAAKKLRETQGIEKLVLINKSG
jgi:hypothetical protein